MSKNRLFLLLLACVCATQTFALTFESGGLWFKATSETTAKVIACKNGHYSGDVVIPETVKYDDLTMTVTRIAEFAFSYDSLMTSVSIPKTVESMGTVSFESCFSLQNINVDPENPYFESVDGVLYNKVHTSLLVVPGGREGEFKVPEGVFSIEFGAFFACRSITKIYIPASVNYIALEYTPYPDPDEDGGSDSEISITLTATSYNYPALQEFVIDEQNQGYAFKNNCFIDKSNMYIIKVLGAVPDHLVIPEGVSGMNSASCRHRSNLKELTIPSSLENIGSFAFQGCPLRKINFPEDCNLKTIESGAFWDAELEDFVIPSSVEYLGEECVIGNPIKTVRIPEGLKSYNMRSFLYAKNLYLPSTITEITGNSSWGLEHIEIAPGGSYVAEDDIVYTADKTKLLFCAENGGPKGAFRIPSTVTTVNEGAFHNNKTITELTVPGSIKSIPFFFFAGDDPNNSPTILTKLILEEGVEDLGNFSFSNNMNLISVSIPSTLKSFDWPISPENNIIEYWDLTENHIVSFYNAQFRHYSKDEPSCIKSTDDGFLYGRSNQQWDTANNKIVLFGYNGLEPDVVIPETIEGEEFVYHSLFMRSCSQVKSVTLPDNKSIFDLCQPYEEAAFFRNAKNTLNKVIIPEHASIEGKHENPFCNVKAGIELHPDNPYMTYEDKVLYSKDKSLLIAYNDLDATEYAIPDDVTDICTYAFGEYVDLHMGRVSSLKKLTLGKNLNTVPTYTFFNLNCEKLVIPDGLKLEFMAIHGSLTENMSHCELELGACDYAENSIQWGVSEMKNPEDCIITCNFNDPAEINCPFVMSLGQLWDIAFKSTLHVPYGTKALFESAPGWGNFLHIEETFEYVPAKHTVTYMLDDEVWYEQTVAVGENITAPAEPQRLGYKFSGWNEIPSVMGKEDIVVTGYLYKLGDVNDDKYVNVADINSTVDVIMGSGTKKMTMAADVNEDAHVDVADIYGIANYLLEGSFVSSAKNGSRKAKGHNAPVALQYDLETSDATVAEELAACINSYVASTCHQVNVAQIDDNMLRCIVYSVSNRIIDCSTDALLNALHDAEVRNIVIVYSMGNVLRANTVSDLRDSGDVTNIEQMNVEPTGSADIYNMMGQKLQKAQRGFNIMNGKKLFVK